MQITVNNIHYDVQAKYGYENKSNHNNDFGVKLELAIIDEFGHQLRWEDFRKTYLAEKLIEGVVDLINHNEKVMSPP